MLPPPLRDRIVQDRRNRIVPLAPSLLGWRAACAVGLRRIRAFGQQHVRRVHGARLGRAMQRREAGVALRFDLCTARQRHAHGTGAVVERGPV